MLSFPFFFPLKELHLEECQPAPDEDDAISLSSCGGDYFFSNNFIDYLISFTDFSYK